ncbi:hypothetical protein ONS96_001142 [Cadophora gregata f. sp. sojae]|nr:hypothetical protein ONS96_001142 [Cadophora gregata f. sp. sojae]
MGDYQPEAYGAFVVCRETSLLPKRVFDILSHCHGLMRVDLAPNHALDTSLEFTSISHSKAALRAKLPGSKTAYVKFADASSAEQAIDKVNGFLICEHQLELSITAPIDLDQISGSRTNSWDHTDQTRWGRGNNALVASMLKLLSTKQIYDSEHISPNKLDDFKILDDDEYEVSISYHQLLQARIAVRLPQDLDISKSTVSEHNLQNLLIDFRAFATRVENMRFLRKALQHVIELPPRLDEVSTKNLFMVGDYLAETNGLTELPVVFQERMHRCLHDDLEKLYAAEVEVDLQWEDIYDEAIMREEDAT